MCRQAVSLTPTMNSFEVDCGEIGDTNATDKVKLDFNIGDGISYADVYIDNVHFGQ